MTREDADGLIDRQPTTQTTTEGDRESPLSVARGWLPWCISLIFVMTISWTAVVSWEEVSNGSHAGFRQTAIAVVERAAPATPFIVVYAIMVVSLLDMLGGFAMVTKRYLEGKFIKPLIAGHEARGEARVQRRWTEWNDRRLKAEADGVPFDEPPPSEDKSNSNGNQS